MMRFKITLFLLLVFVSGFFTPAYAGSYIFKYKLKPGQKFLVTQMSQTESAFMGKKDVNRSRAVLAYRITKGPKKGWVTLWARIKAQIDSKGKPVGDHMGLTKINYRADMHSSGEIRRINYEAPPVQPAMNTENLPPEVVAMMKNSANMMAEAWKHSIYWFPEFPEFKMSIGDEFDVTRKIGMGGMGAGMQSQTVTKQVFTLEDVSKGLAYFSVKERSITKTKGIAGGQAKTKSLGKSEAIFDLRTGMWIEFISKYRTRVQMGAAAPGMQGNQEVLHISKYEIDFE